MALAEKPKSLGKFLAERREDFRGTPKEFAGQDVANALGFSQAYISKLEHGGLDRTVHKWKADRVWTLLKAYKFTDEEALEIAKRFDLDIPPRQPHLASFQTDTQVPLGQAVQVYAAGTGPAWDDSSVLETVYVPDNVYPGVQKVGLKAMSTSMEPYLPQGAVAVVALDDGLVQPGDYCGVWLHGDGVVVKRFVQEVGNGELLLESLRPDPGEPGIFTAPLGSRIMGKVVARLIYG